MKRQPIEWEKILVNYISDEGLISKIHKELLQLNSQKKKKIQLKHGQDTRVDIFSKKIYKFTKGQRLHEKGFRITNHQGNAKPQ